MLSLQSKQIKTASDLPTPKMILFDNGKTLTYEPGADSLRATKAIMPYITKNPLGLTAEQINSVVQDVFKELQPLRDAGYEFQEWNIVQMAYGKVGIEFCIDQLTFEHIFWTELSPGMIMPHADELLRFLNKAGIRTGVISDIVFSGKALTERLDSLLPDNQFEFVIASSDYVVRKPGRALFEVALYKAALRPGEIWYCGDSFYKDVIGAHSVGFFPVLYSGNLPATERKEIIESDESTDVSYLKINDWREMIGLLKEMT